MPCAHNAAKCSTFLLRELESACQTKWLCRVMRTGMRRLRVRRGYGVVVAKAENARSRDFLRRRGFDILFQRGAQAAMQASTSAITT